MSNHRGYYYNSEFRNIYFPLDEHNAEAGSVSSSMLAENIENTIKIAINLFFFSVFQLEKNSRRLNYYFFATNKVRSFKTSTSKFAQMLSDVRQSRGRLISFMCLVVVTYTVLIGYVLTVTC